MKNKSNSLLLALACVLSFSKADAVVLFGADNTANLTNPGSGLPFDTVGRVSSLANIEDGGSGVHLGNGFMITAAHIPDSELNSVTFDSSTFFMRDLSYIPVQIGTADLKIFKLTTTPTIGSATLYNGSAELLNNASLVGFGSGRMTGTPVNTLVVPFAPGGSPLPKRWGTNQPRSEVQDFSYNSGATNYTFDALVTTLGSSSGIPSGNGDFEAAAGTRDSGSGLFQEIGGIWYLTGITSVIAQRNAGNATFGNDVPAVISSGSPSSPSTIGLSLGGGDPNVFVQVSTYQSQIATLIPEPSVALLSLLALPFALRRRR